MTTPSDRIPTRRPDLTIVELDGEAVVYDDRSGTVHHLNETAALLFTLLDGSAALGEIAAEVAVAYGVPVDEVTAQLRELVKAFDAAGLLEEERVPDRGEKRR